MEKLLYKMTYVITVAILAVALSACNGLYRFKSDTEFEIPLNPHPGDAVRIVRR